MSAASGRELCWGAAAVRWPKSDGGRLGLRSTAADAGRGHDGCGPSWRCHGQARRRHARLRCTTAGRDRLQGAVAALERKFRWGATAVLLPESGDGRRVLGAAPAGAVPAGAAKARRECCWAWGCLSPASSLFTGGCGHVRARPRGSGVRRHGSKRCCPYAHATLHQEHHSCVPWGVDRFCRASKACFSLLFRRDMHTRIPTAIYFSFN